MQIRPGKLEFTTEMRGLVVGDKGTLVVTLVFDGNMELKGSNVEFMKNMALKVNWAVGSDNTEKADGWILCLSSETLTPEDKEHMKGQ